MPARGLKEGQVSHKRTEPIYTNPEDKYWSLYLAQADKDDVALMDSLDRNTNGILVFVGTPVRHTLPLC